MLNDDVITLVQFQHCSILKSRMTSLMQRHPCFRCRIVALIFASV